MFLELIHFLLGVIGIIYRKRILKGSSPSIAEIIERRKQKTISTIPAGR